MRSGKKYRIGLEASSALSHKVSGIQRYIRELVSALAGLAEFEPNLELELCYKGNRINKKGCRPDLPMGYRWYWPVPGFSTGRYDLVHSLDSSLPWSQPSRMVCTVHDLFSAVLDGYSSHRFRKRKIHTYQRLVRCCDAIIVPSNATKQDIIEYLAYPENRIYVVQHGVQQKFFQVPAESTSKNSDIIPAEPYILCFGPQKRKNFSRVLRAFIESGLYNTHLLLVVGCLDPEAIAFLQGKGIENRVIGMAGVADEKMPALYMGASALCFPSMYEGFGLPILEAMACGIPVITSRISATAELGSKHAVLVSPESVQEIARGIKQALTFDRFRLARAKEYARRFTWDETAKATLSIYKEILNI
ncbi:MAG: glycosyltransferase family 4 protein [Desulfobacteraceae bacterium]|nr:glycosyltransferase family 4 protein [Desulfobacteraceae bacterium]